MEAIRKILIQAQSATGQKGSLTPLDFAEQVRVYAEWAAGVTAGVVTVRTRANQGGLAESAGTLAFSAGAANSLRIDGPLGEVEAEITTTVSGGGSPSVTVTILANG